MKNKIRKTATVALAAALVINPLLPNIEGVNNIVMAAENVDQQVARLANEARILVRKAAPELTMDQIEEYLKEVNELRSELNSIDTWDDVANVANAALAQDIDDALAIVQDAEEILLEKKKALTPKEYTDNEKVQRDINTLEALSKKLDNIKSNNFENTTLEPLMRLFSEYKTIDGDFNKYSYNKHDNSDTSLLSEYHSAHTTAESDLAWAAYTLINKTENYVDNGVNKSDVAEAIKSDTELDLIQKYKTLINAPFTFDQTPDMQSAYNTWMGVIDNLNLSIDELEKSIKDKEATAEKEKLEKIYSDKLDELEKNLQGLPKNIEDKGTLERYKSSLEYLQRELNKLGQGFTEELESRRKGLQQSVQTRLNNIDKLEEYINRKEAEAKDRAEKENNKKQVEESINNLTGSNKDKKSKAEDLLNNLDNMNLSPEDKAKLKQDLENIIKDLDKEIKDENDNKALDKIKQDLDQIENKPGSSKEDLQASLDKLNKTAEELDKVNPSDPKVKAELEKQIKDLKGKLEKQLAEIEAKEKDQVEKENNKKLVEDSLDSIVGGMNDRKQQLEDLLKELDKLNLNEKDRQEFRSMIEDEIALINRQIVEEKDVFDKKSNNNKMNEALDKILKDNKTPQETKDALEKLLKDVEKENLSERDKSALRKKIQDHIDVTEKIIKSLEAQKEVEQDIRRITEAPITHNAKKSELEKLLKELPNFDLDEAQRNKLEREIRQLIEEFVIKENNDRVAEFEKRLEELESRQYSSSTSINFDKIEDLRKAIDELPKDHPMRQKLIDKLAKIEGEVKKVENIQKEIEEAKKIANPEERKAKLEELQRRILLLPPSEDRDALLAQLGLDTQTIAEINNPQMGDAGTMLSSGLIGLSALGLSLIGKKKKED